MKIFTLTLGLFASIIYTNPDIVDHLNTPEKLSYHPVKDVQFSGKSSSLNSHHVWIQN
jgi:hypothetical protein